MGARKDGTLSLPNGADVAFRVIEPDDVPALQRFHERLSDNTIYLRFFGSMGELSEEKAEYAALVEDRWQGCGVGMELTYLLIDEARDKGVQYL